jgi:hypothetical protein
MNGHDDEDDPVVQRVKGFPNTKLKLTSFLVTTKHSLYLQIPVHLSKASAGQLYLFEYSRNTMINNFDDNRIVLVCININIHVILYLIK